MDTLGKIWILGCYNSIIGDGYLSRYAGILKTSKVLATLRVIFSLHFVSSEGTARERIISLDSGGVILLYCIKLDMGTLELSRVPMPIPTRVSYPNTSFVEKGIQI